MNTDPTIDQLLSLYYHARGEGDLDLAQTIARAYWGCPDALDAVAAELAHRAAAQELHAQASR